MTAARLHGTPVRSAESVWSPGAIAVAVFVALFGFVPLVNLIPGGRAAPWYAPALAEWLNGSLIAIGGGVVYALLSRRALFWRRGLLRPLLDSVERRPGVAILMLCAVTFIVYASVSQLVFDGRPLLIDEIVQLLQARIFSEGLLARHAFRYPEFFSALHVIDSRGLYFSQFPAGGPAMYVLGWVADVPWLTNPLCGVIGVAAFARFVWETERDRAVVAGAVLLFAFAPFAVFMSASHMNHVPTLMWTMVAIMALALVVESQALQPGWAFVIGLGFGCAASIRPVDALAFALPAGLWLLARAVSRREWRELATSALGVGGPLALLLWINSRTTGSPLLFGYELLWGSSHSLGFHRAPWGFAHTPARGVELISLYFLRLQSYLFETPIPSLLPAIGALALTRRLNRYDRYLLASAGLLVVLYFAYWHDGFYLGPRFLFPLLPLFAIWTARLPRLVRARFGEGTAYRATWGALSTSVLIAGLVSIPLRGRQYARGLLTMRWNADRAAARAHVADAIVLVRESWGSQLVARMWALGVSRSEAERFYRHVDSCELDSALAQMETQGDGASAAAALAPMLRDSSAVRSSPFSSDTTEGFRRGARYRPACLARLADDRAGYTILTPLLLARRSDVLYARDLHARDSLLLQLYPRRAVFLLRPRGANEGAPPEFESLNRDSLYKAWRTARE